ncbi:MAG: N-acetylmuramoyl-L-alanine amidase [Spirochaetales bacterium]|nr:N-acetylmuramoyl-L-alanine amidase [Spirochaetales bacterium]
MEKILTAAALILLISVYSFTEEVSTEMISINEIIETTGAEFRWDPFRFLGELSLSDQTVIFQPGIPFLLINYSEKTETVSVVRGREGGIYFSREGADIIIDLFSSVSVPVSIVKVKAIIIDPGHGGKDPGAVGRFHLDDGQFELKEKDVVLSVAMNVAERLKSTYSDKQVILTRSTDEFISLEQRTVIANSIELGENEAIIFVSVHANASLNPRANGFEVWYLPPEYRRDLLDDSTIESELSDVVPILNTMLEEEITVESILLAQSIQKGLTVSIGDKIEDRGLKEESWFVVRKAKMPAVLVELGFITNQKEALTLRDESYLKKVGEGIYNGISGFINHFEMQYFPGE